MTRVMELRIHRIRDGAGSDFERLARQTLLPLFAKHGFRFDRFWADSDDPRTVYFLTTWESEDEMAAKGQAFYSDPDWIAVRTAPDFVPVFESTKTVVLSPAVGPND